MADRRLVVLDTDIGSDVDDALALAVLLGSPEVDLLGVTTVYGDTTLRARIARRLARLAGRDGLAVVPGAERPLGGGEAWWAGFEGQLYDDLDAEPVDDGRGAAEYLVETAATHAGALDVVAIGPLTNIAEAIRADPPFVRDVRRLYVMGGRFDGPDPEHNFASDPEATATVFESGVSVTAVGLEITTLVRLAADHIARIAARGELGRQLAVEVRQWWEYTYQDWNHPHDPLAVLTMLTPDLFGLRPVDVGIERSGERAGASVAVDSAGSSTFVVDAVDVDRALEEMLVRIESAAT